MAKIDYNFDLGNPRPRHGAEWERKVRIALLFGIVTVITGIVIYAIIPSRKPGKTVEDPTKHPEAVKQPDPTVPSTTGEADVDPVSAPPVDPRKGVVRTADGKSASGADVAVSPIGLPKKGEVAPGDPSP